jgi:RNA polymerase-binding transcription factor DksA
MNALQEKLFLELRQTKVEIENSLNSKQNKDWFTTVLEEELSDITSAIQKLENGNFGQCEISGEFLPNELLNIIPTLRSQKDSEYLESYFKKPIYHSF